MKIAKISLKDFRIYDQETVTFSEPLSVFKGQNHSGKTSLAQAIKLALSKCADGTDPRGAGALDKVRLGANKAIIETVIEGKQGLVTLTTQYGPGRTGRTQKIAPENFAGPFDKYLDANQERLSCVLDSFYFIAQKPEAQKAILATLVLPTAYEFDPEMVTLAEGHLGKFVWDKIPVAVIDQVYEAAYNARRTAKATLAGIRIPAKPSEPQHSAEIIQEKLAALRAKAAKESKALAGGGTVQIGRIEQSLEQQSAALAISTQEMDSLLKQRDEMDESLTVGEELEVVKRLAAGRNLYAQLQAKKNTLLAEVAQQHEAQAIYEELLQDDEGNSVDEACCPTCTQSITRKFINSKIGEHKKLENEAAAAAASIAQEQAELGDIAGAEAKLQTNAKVVSDALSLTRSIKQAQAQIDASQAKIETLTSQLAQAKAEVQEPANTTALDKINAELAEWESRLSPALNYNATLEQMKTLTAQWVAQKDVVADLEVLCEHFGKDGIKAELIAKHIGEFSDTVNSVLSAWGYSAKLEIEPYSFLVTTPAGELPLKELSGSEKLMFSVALQTAMAVHGKIKMVVVDEGDTFVGSERGRLLGCLKKLLDAGTLDQALVFASEIDRTKINKPGVATYWIEAGKVVAL